MKNKLRIIMYSSADKVDGQGVGSAYQEQVQLIQEGASDLFEVEINNWTKKPDIQHFHTIDPAFFAKMQDTKACNIAYCHFLPDTMDGSIKLPESFMSVFNSYLIKFYKSADRLVVVNPSFINELVALGIDRHKIYYIPNYVSKEKFYRKSDEERFALREKYGLSPSDFVVFGAGQVQTRKGVLDFVEVAKALPDYQFVWAGGFSFGRITDGYEQLKALQEDPPANVKFLGIVPRDEMADLYNVADVLFVPSYNELFPMTILEAVNLHIPLVLRDLDLYKDILFEKYMKGNNNEDFVACLKQLKEDPEMCRLASDNSLLISEYYSKENVLAMWRKFYMEAFVEKQNQLYAKKMSKKHKGYLL